MKTKWKIALATFALLSIALSFSSVGAYYWHGGSYNRSTNTIVDTNVNGIADWLEDYDSDWILNRDDTDFVKTYVNMRDDDWDWIANRDDTDYVRVQDGTWRGYWRIR